MNLNRTSSLAWIVLIVSASSLTACNSYTDPMCNDTNRIDLPGFEGNLSVYDLSGLYSSIHPEPRDVTVSRLGVGKYKVSGPGYRPDVSVCNISGKTYIEYQPVVAGYRARFFSIARIRPDGDYGWTADNLSFHETFNSSESRTPFLAASLVKNRRLNSAEILDTAEVLKEGFASVRPTGAGRYAKPSLKPFTPETRTSISGSVFTKVSPDELKRMGVDAEKFGEAWQDPSRVIWSDAIRIEAGGPPSKVGRAQAAAYCNSIGASLPTNSTLEKLAEYLGKGTAGGYVAEILPNLEKAPIWSLEIVGTKTFALNTESRPGLGGRLLSWPEHFETHFRCAR